MIHWLTRQSPFCPRSSAPLAKPRLVLWVCSALNTGKTTADLSRSKVSPSKTLEDESLKTHLTHPLRSPKKKKAKTAGEEKKE